MNTLKILFASLLLPVVLHAGDAPEPAGKPNILILLADDMGYGDLGFREDGYDKPLPGGPVACGFETFFGFRASTDIPPYFYIRGDRAVTPPTDHIAARHSEGWSSNQGEFWREGGIAPGMALMDVLPRLTDEALEVINTQVRANRDARKPFLLYFAPTAPHTPWLPSPEFAGKSGAGMYGDFTMMVDAEIGRILTALDKSGLAKDTLVIFTSDNGPTWYEADVERLGHASADGWRGMKSDPDKVKELLSAMQATVDRGRSR